MHISRQVSVAKQSVLKATGQVQVTFKGAWMKKGGTSTMIEGRLYGILTSRDKVNGIPDTGSRVNEELGEREGRWVNVGAIKKCSRK